ncbi:MAG: hypothetical protein OIF35_06315, partial [Cellvibrionaceae bacterium]|nr:hypothetical protein [Cellvibrionaceae bacterium]
MDIIHMNGRIYSPELGGMMSPDPVTQALGSGRNYNRYTYGFNNPLRYTDPDGYQVCLPPPPGETWCADLPPQSIEDRYFTLTVYPEDARLAGWFRAAPITPVSDTVGLGSSSKGSGPGTISNGNSEIPDATSSSAPESEADLASDSGNACANIVCTVDAFQVMNLMAERLHLWHTPTLFRQV